MKEAVDLIFICIAYCDFCEGKMDTALEEKKYSSAVVPKRPVNTRPALDDYIKSPPEQARLWD